ncbi:MAG TPA: hypothetical protein VK363_19415 [Pyrinomonadaceae bacterium]|nr:hypothetical protein [Pyrinomonadaceae bacterium]
MATETSIVGDWQLTPDWHCDGSNPPGHFQITFNADGSLLAGGSNGGWLQVGGMAFWSLKDSPELIYTANVNPNALVGVMGYASSSRNDTGCFYAKRIPSGATSSVVSGATPEEVKINIFGPSQPEQA